MAKKLTQILFLVLFGAVMFVMGGLMPESGKTIPEPGAPEKKEKAAPAAADPQAGQAGKTEKAEGKEEKALPYRALEITAAADDKAVYALQVGLFQEKQNAGYMEEMLKKEKLAPFYLEVLDERDQKWYVLAVGKYKTLEEARSAVYWLLTEKEIKSRVIQLP